MAINVKDKLVTVESLGIAYSTEQGARQEADQALSTRIDNIVAPDGDPSLTEVSDARVSGSTTHNTLKARLDADQAAVGTEIAELKADLDNASGRLTAQQDWSIIKLVNQKVYITADWELGSIRNNNGVNIDTIQYRVRTKNILYTSADITLYAEKTYSVLIYYYDATGTFIREEEKGQQKYTTIPAGSYYRAVIRRVPDDTSAIANIYDYVTHVYHDFTGMYLRSDKEQVKSDEEQIVTLKNIGTVGFKTLFPETELTKNLYNPDYELKGKRIDLNTGNIVDDSNYNLYKVIVPTGKTVVCTGIKSTLPSQRSYPNIVRSNLVYNNYGSIESSDSASATASVYKNTQTTDRTIYLNLWSDTNEYMTVTDLMIELVDNSTLEANYITNYVPYGFMPKGDIYNGVTNVLHPPRHFFGAEVERVVEKVRLAQAGVNYTFAFITDTHYTPGDADSYRYTVDTFSNVKKISELIPLDAVVHGGDFVARLWGGETQEETNAAISMIRGWMMQSNVGRNVHITPGNHEGIDGSSSPATGLYGVMMTQDNATVIRDGDSYDCYYDMVAQKLRVIMLSNAVRVNNVIGVSASGLAWLNSVLASVPTGYNVMVISHISPSSADFVTNKSEVVTALNTWHNNASNGQIVAWIAGHEHFDWIVPSSISGCDFPVVICTCSMRNARIPSETEEANGAKIVSPRNAYTVAQDAWTVFVYQPSLGKIEKIRFGLGDDETIDFVNWTSS